MEFENNQIIQENQKFINLGKINNEFALIFSNYKINEFKLFIDNNKMISKEDNNYVVNYDGKNIDLIYPCEKDHMKINSKSKYIIIKESANDYQNLILPYIKGIYSSNIKWIIDIIYHDRESEKILYRNKEFLVIKDISWTDDKSKKNFYVLVIPEEKIKTIRDLRKKHIPLLKSMKQKSIDVASAYGIDENQLYFFFHYHPSFYHLHLHCCIINNPELSTKYFRCKMLETIISNLERNSNYYKNADILFEIPSNHIIAKLLS